MNKMMDYLLSLNNLRKIFGFQLIGQALGFSLKQEIIDQFSGKRLLILAPHPDDDVLGCGGVIALNQKNGGKTVIVYMRERKNDVRRKEAEKAAALLGAETRFWGMGNDEIDGRVPDLLDELVSRFDPDIICSPGLTDPHPEHYDVSAMLGKVLSRNNFKGEIWQYCVWQPIYANRLINIDSVIEIKKEAVLAHTSQLKDRPYLEAILGLNTYRAKMFGAGEYCEAFLATNKKIYLKLFELTKLKIN
ncbi:MAG: PIG-L family deacetylase [Patescibacteria group bacterium]